MPLDDLAADGQAYARALVLGPAVQALEDIEDPVAKLVVEPNPVVLYGDPTDRERIGLSVRASRELGERTTPDLDHGGPIGGVEFQGVADEVLQQLTDLGRVGLQGR